MKTAIVNGQEISKAAVGFELERLVRFYVGHGISEEEIRKSMSELEEKALEQAIGAKLLLERAMQVELPVSGSDIDQEVAKVIDQVGGMDNYRQALAQQKISEETFRKELEKGARVNMLVSQACAHVSDPTEQEVSDFYAAHKGDYVSKDGVQQTIVDVHDQIKDLLRHMARGRATEQFVAELRSNAKIEYKEGK